ncbi:MAG: capsule assembly Wzi family protein [Dysgonamonadaceae bacterium]|jgi:hypothetical protein|nr:capsule assembly Wzi family protein [Dysgonamonadaceae bacterium]
MKRLVFPVLWSLVALSAFAQIEDSYRVETFGSVASGENTPFWMVNRNWGMTALAAGNFYVKGGVFHQQKINTDWSFDAGIDLAGGSSAAYGKAWIQQLYGRLNWKAWRIDIGVREDYTSYLNPLLSSGDFARSNNARPFPQIKVSLSDYILVPYTKGNMFLKGDFSIGKYLDGQWQEDRALPHREHYTKNVLSHNKSIYFKFGDIETKHRKQFTFGMVHFAQWSGTLYRFMPEAADYRVTAQPHRFSDFLRVAIAKEGSSGSSSADAAYVAGSQLGTYLFKWDYKRSANERLSVYLHHFFDDGSGMVFENYYDNLLGLEFQSKDRSLLSGAVFEYIYTKQQTGPVHHNIGMDDAHRDKLMHKGNGNDNYYNNVDYVQGPSYFGKTMGTPLFLSPEYNTDGSLNFKSSRIIAFHLGLEGYFHPAFQYRLLLTTGQSWGRYYVPFKTVKKGVASQLELIYRPSRICGAEIKLVAGFDKGDFFGGDTFGAGLTLSKQGVIFAQ